MIEGSRNGLLSSSNPIERTRSLEFSSMARPQIPRILNAVDQHEKVHHACLMRLSIQISRIPDG